MYIQLKDHTGKQHRVPAEGAIFGRDRSRCDVVLPDIGVSGVHAKIYCRQGRWFLEDLHSSNGTFVGDDRVNGPVELSAGLAFGLFRWRFEVTDIDTTPEERSGPGAPTDPSKTAPRPTSKGEVSSVGPGVTRSASRPSKSRDTEEAEMKTTAAPKPGVATAAISPAPAPAAPAAAPSPAPEDDDETDAADDAVPTIGVALKQFTPGRFLTGVKDALAHYLIAIPKLAVRPLGYVRESIAEPRHGTMMQVELAAWAFLPMAIGVVATTVASLAVSLVGHSFSVGQVLISPAISLAVVLVSSMIAGLIWHPWNAWVIQKLGGSSTAKQRSNMFVVLYTATPLAALASAVGVLLTLVPLLFVNSVGYLLSVLASLITMFVVYAWYRHFKVAKWFQLALLVLGALWAASGVLNVVRVTRVNVAVLMSGTGSTPVAVTTSAKVPVKESTVSGTPGTPAATPRDEGGSAVISTPTVVSTTAVKPAVEVKPTPAAMVAVKEAPPAAVAEAVVPSVAAAASNPSLSYAQYLVKREAVEKSIEADPPVLTRVKGLLDLYRRLHAEVARVDDKYGKGKKSDANEVVNKRMHDAEVYDATVSLVLEMEQMIRAEGH